MNRSLTFIANWKMCFSFEQTIAFATQHYDELTALAQDSKVILCPSFTTLYHLCTIYKETNVKIGAQDCSDHPKGAFTGQVSVESLKQLGCTFCIIGHSERRHYNHETDENVTNKFLQLIEQGIIPIICMGETIEEYKENKAFEVLEKQLTGILAAITNQPASFHNLPLYIAYEPVWSIGTGLIPTTQHLELIFAWLAHQTYKAAPFIQWKLLYGGSVKSDNVKILSKIPALDGFLIGGASLDFQEFKKIVECVE